MLQKARGGGPPPSWGDVAERVGEFAKEEQGLKQTVGRLDAESAKPGAAPRDSDGAIAPGIGCRP